MGYKITGKGFTVCVKALLGAGADVDKITRVDGWTALMLAAKRGFTGCRIFSILVFWPILMIA